MKKLQGKGITGGRAAGPAMVSRMPVNFTAAHTKPPNIIPGKLSRNCDRHHDFFKKNVKGKVLVFPAAIGSTYTGMVLLELMYQGVAPVAVIVQAADSLLVSGAVLADVWFGRGIPIIEYPADDIFTLISDGDNIEVDGSTGAIKIFN